MKRLKAGAFRDLIIILLTVTFLFALAPMFDLFEKLPVWLGKYVAWEIDEIFTVMLTLALAFGVFSLRRWLALGSEFRKCQQMEESLRASGQRFLLISEQTPFAVIERNLKGEVTGWNPAAETMFGFSKSEALGRHVSELILPQSAAEQARKAWNQILIEKRGMRTVDENRTKDGHTIICEWQVTPLIDNRGNLIEVVSLGHDITERIRAKEALQTSEGKFRTLAETTSASIFITRGTKLSYVNSAAETTTGYSREELQAMNFWDIMHPEWEDLAKERGLMRLRGEPVPSQYECPILTKNGQERWLDVTAGVIDLDGQPDILVTAFDITERKRMETELEVAHQRLRFHVENSPLAVVEWDHEFQVRRWSAQAEKIFGWKAEEVLGQRPTDWRFIFADDIKAVREVMNHFRDQESRNVTVNRNYRKDGSVIHCEWYNSALLDDSGHLVSILSLVQDISERKRAEAALRQSEEQLRTIIDNMPVMVWAVDDHLNIIAWNLECERVSGYTAKEIIKNQKAMKLLYPDGAYRKQMLADQDVRAGNFRDWEWALTCKDGSQRTIAWSSISHRCPIPGWAFWGTGVDITERKQAGKQIKTSLKEKEVLLKEIHHRVKNNMQVISSLLDLQTNYIKDQQAIEIFNDCRNRVRSMALIHEGLYKSGDLARINFGEHIQELITHLFSSYGIDPGAIAPEIAAADVWLGIDRAIPCSLIINELVSNSLKYAFPNGQRGEVRVDFQAHDDKRMTLSVSDTGVGLQQDFDFQHVKTLGLKLVRRLTEQLDGRIEIDRSRGTAFKISFLDPTDEEKK